jgi:hypothetical protein
VDAALCMTCVLPCWRTTLCWACPCPQDGGSSFLMRFAVFSREQAHAQRNTGGGGQGEDLVSFVEFTRNYQLVRVRFFYHNPQKPLYTELPVGGCGSPDLLSALVSHFVRWGARRSPLT